MSEHGPDRHGLQMLEEVGADTERWIDVRANLPPDASFAAWVTRCHDCATHANVPHRVVILGVGTAYETTGNAPMICEVCRQTLGLPGGMGGSGMCGPCATGESETADERGETW